MHRHITAQYKSLIQKHDFVEYTKYTQQICEQFFLTLACVALIVITHSNAASSSLNYKLN